jgi:hypothetical protein
MMSSFIRFFSIGVLGLAAAAAILNYGAVQPLTFLLVLISLHVSLFLSVSFFGFPRPTERIAALALFILGAVSLWVLLQTLPLPSEWHANAAWSGIAERARPVISVTPGDDVVGLLQVSMPFAAFLAALILFDTDKRAMRLVRGLTIGATVIAAVLLFQFTLSPTSLLLGEKRAYLDSFTGSFVNRNTAATFFGVASVLALALAWRELDKADLNRVFRALLVIHTLPYAQRRPLKFFALYGVLFTSLLVALLLTKSRAGIAATLFGFSVFAVLRLGRNVQRRLGRKQADGGIGTWSFRRHLLMAGGSIGVICLVLLLTGQTMLRAEIATRQDPRFCAAPAIITGITETFPVGGGLSSFRDLFPKYRDPRCGTVSVWDRAHNVYLEGLFSLGILFPFLVALFVGSLTWVFVTGVSSRRNYRVAPEAGLSILVLVLAHSAFDFSLQIPGFAVYYALVLAPLVTLSRNRSAGRGGGIEPVPVTPAGDRNAA